VRAWKEQTAQLRRQAVPPDQWPPQPRQQWDEAQPGYYPALLTPAEHADLLAAIAARRPAAMGRTDQQRWIAAGLTACVCGETMGATGSSRLHATGRRRYVYLRCRGGCSSPMVPIALAQAHLLTRLTGDQFAAMLEHAAGSDRAQLLASAIAQQQNAERQVVQIEQQHAAGEQALAAETDAAVVSVLARRAATIDSLLAAARQVLAEARADVARLQAAPSLAAMGAEARAQICTVLARFAGGTDTVEDRRMVARHLVALGVRVTIDAAARRLALQIGDGPLDWQPLDRELAEEALGGHATGAQFFEGDEDGLGAGVEWFE
jgi:hypothetical protein